MIMRKGERWICSNPECRCEVEVVIASQSADGNPKCCCGWRMKKPYRAPSFRQIGNQDELKVVLEKFSSSVV